MVSWTLPGVVLEKRARIKSWALLGTNPNPNQANKQTKITKYVQGSNTDWEFLDTYSKFSYHFIEFYWSFSLSSFGSFCLFVFWAHQWCFGLLMALCSGTTPNDLRDHWEQWIEPELASCEASVLTTVISLQPPFGPFLPGRLQLIHHSAHFGTPWNLRVRNVENFLSFCDRLDNSWIG